MRIITFNANGIRSAAKKGFFNWLFKQHADVICIQETKAQMHQLTDPLFYPEGYHHYFHDAQKPGYSGVAIYSKHKPENVIKGLGWPCADNEGRYVQLDLGGLSIASIYLPSGTSGPERQAHKFEFMDLYMKLLRARILENKPMILCGDWNIAHKNIDLKNWRGNQKNSGFLPEERAWLDELFDTVGYIDAFRSVNKEPDQYTWWSNRGQARAKNVGWRIDYQIITPDLQKHVQAVSIYKDEWFSDHAPLIVDYSL